MATENQVEFAITLLQTNKFGTRFVESEHQRLLPGFSNATGWVDAHLRSMDDKEITHLIHTLL